MVGSVTSVTRNGLRDWLIQRVSSYILMAYIFFLVGYLMAHQPLQFADWSALFHHEWMRVFSFLALLSTVYHAWVGIWTIFTDYVKCPQARVILQCLVVIALLSYLVWGVSIVWSIL